MSKAKTPTDEKIQDAEFDLFSALAALDRKDYGYYDTLTEEQQKKFVPYMLLIWTSVIKGKPDIQNYYLQSTEYHANKYFFNENVQHHPKLQWMMLCACSPGIGKQFHQYIPHLNAKIARLEEKAKTKDVQTFFKKFYAKADEDTLTQLSEFYTKQQNRKVYFAEKYPHLKIDDIDLLNELITDEEIAEYERNFGN